MPLTKDVGAIPVKMPSPSMNALQSEVSVLSRTENDWRMLGCHGFPCLAALYAIAQNALTFPAVCHSL